MIAREKKLLPIKEHHVTARMAGNWNSDQIAIQTNLVLTANQFLNPEPLPAVIGVHDSSAVKLLGKAAVIGNIVLVSEKHRGDAAERIDLLDQLCREPR